MPNLNLVENFAKGIENAPNNAAQQGVDTAGEVNGSNTLNIVYLNDKTGEGDDGTSYFATNAPDIFVYDFSTADTTDDSFQIDNFDVNEDTIIYINAEVPLEGGTNSDESEEMTNFRYEDFETNSTGDRQGYSIVITEEQGPSDRSVLETRISSFDSDTGIATSNLDIIGVGDEGTSPLPGAGLQYPADTTDPVATFPDTTVYVYQGDPLADGLLG